MGRHGGKGGSRVGDLEALFAWLGGVMSPGQAGSAVQSSGDPGKWGVQAEAVEARVTAFERQLWALPRRVRRALQRHWALPLAEVALLLALWQGPGWAATIEVTGRCTLVNAIIAANTDRATGGCRAGSGADTIVLPPGSTQRLRRVDNTTYGPTGLPVVTSKITIAGQGSTIVRTGHAPAFRLLAVGSGGKLTVRDLSLRGGAAAGDSLFCPAQCGGGVYNAGSLTLANSTLSGNSAGFFGGGLFNAGTATVTNSTVSGNTAEYAGGLSNYLGTVTLTNSTVSGNTGGGVYNGSVSTMTLMNSTISGNSGGTFSGFGVYNGGTLTITQSTISGNSRGGVINAGSLTLTNSTISGNTTPYDGGGVFNYGGTLTLTNSTLTGNSAATGGGVWSEGGPYSGRAKLHLVQTLVTGNTAEIGAEIYHRGKISIITANHFNLFGHDAKAGVVGFTPGASDIVPSVPLTSILNPTLASNGGPTQTHALVPGSPAIDQVPAEDCLPTDQRGFLRPGVGATACDIGAFEFGARPP